MATSKSPDSSRPRLAGLSSHPGVDHAAEARQDADAKAAEAAPSRPATPPTPPTMDVPRRTRLLTAERLHASIRKVARNRHVPDGDVDDILQETIARAWKAQLPDRDDEVTKYVHRIAANVASERMGQPRTERYVENPDEEEDETAAPIGTPPPCFETRDVVRRLVEKGEEAYPKGFPTYLEAKSTEVTAEQIAKRRGVTAGHVRHEWWEIQGLMQRHGRAMGLTATVLLLLFVIGSLTDWSLFRGSRVVAHPNPELSPLPPSDPVALRHRAEGECAANAWKECASDLDAANAIDPSGETRELRDSRALAKKNLEGAPPPR